MSEIKKCPKCGNYLERGQPLRTTGFGSLVTLNKKDDNWMGDSLIPFYCNTCGYVELYNANYVQTK